MRKCDLTNVPTKKSDTRIIYDWQKAIGLIIPFEYDSVQGAFEIINYISRDKVYIKYNNKEYMLYGKYLKKGKIAKIFDQPVDWYYTEGDIISDTRGSHNRQLKIIKRKYVEENKNPNVRSHKYYQYKCLICGYDCSMDNFWINERDLKAGKGCGCCAGTKVLKGINDINTTAPWIVPYIKDSEYAYTHTRTSNKKTDCICPVCGYEKQSDAYHLLFQGYGCPNCSDEISYPEKFMMSVLKQSGIKFKYQASRRTLPWAKKYKYDFYLPTINWIIETHGSQHYIEGWHRFKLQKKTDKEKRELAVINNITNYIELDCSKSKIDYIVNSIQSSVLNSIITNINYDVADKFASSSFLVESCMIYANNPNIEINQIADLFNVTKGTIIRYLKKGKEIGLCQYEKNK